MKRPLENPPEGDVATALARQRRAVAVLLALAAFHTWLTWGYTGLLWSEHGRWLHEVSRFAGGEIPYRDFDWRYPPLAIWLVGTLSRITGTSLTAISSITAALFLFMFGTFIVHLKRSAPDLVLGIGLPALLFAVAYAMRNGIPLPLGSDSISSLVGFLCLQLTVVFALLAADRPGATAPAIAAGVAAAATVLTRHEMGWAAIWMLAASAVLLWRPRTRVALAAGAACVAILGIALAVAAAMVGMRPVIYMLMGSGRSIQVLASAMPSIESLTVELAASAAVTCAGVIALWLCLAISDRTAVRWVFGLGLIFLTASATHLGMTVAIGSDLFSSRPDPLPSATQNFLWQAARGGHGLTASAIGFLDRRIQAHLFPALLPPVLLAALLLRWNAWRDAQLRNRVAVLLGLCVVMRLRSGFAGAEWYNVFAELPTTIMFLRLATAVEPQKAGRAVRALLGIFVLLGLYAYVSLGRGPLTFIGRFPSHPTAAGPIRWPPREFQEFHRVDSLANGIDPARSRPVFAFGLTGGWNYFLGRRNPSPLTEGSATSPFRVDSLIEEMRNMRPGPLVIDNKHTPWPAVSPKSSIFQWEPDPEPSPYARIDRARFDRLREGCTPAGRADTTQMITLYDCAMRALTPPGSSP